MMSEELRGEAKARQDLDTAMRARVSIIGIESPEERRVLGAIQKLAAEETVGISGETFGARVLFQWTNTRGIIRLGDLPKCDAYGCGDDTELVTVDGEYMYRCLSCSYEQEAEFPGGTEDPSFAIQDFVAYAQGDGTPEAYQERASILVMCDIHRFTTSEYGENPNRTVRALRDMAAKLAATKSHAVLLAPHLGDLGDADRHVHRVEWPLPTVEELANMVKDVAAKMEGRIDVDLNGSTEDLAAALAALTMEEAARILKLALVREKRLAADMAPALMASKADILQQAAGIKVRTPRFTLADVGGLDYLKTNIANLPRFLSRAAKEANVRAPRGYLFGGPPGTGKSLVAEAMAAAANVPLIEWNIGESKSKWVGESERQVADVLRAADAISRCVLWIDEGEKQVGGQGGDNSHEVTESIMGAILKWMQDRDSDVVVAMTVNHPENIRPEMMSRFDSKWFVDYPGPEACAAIIDIHTRRRGLEFSENDLITMAAHAAGSNLSGREIEHVIEEAKRQAFIDGVTLEEWQLSLAFTSTKGLASQPSRAAAIEAMRTECKGQFQPAAPPTGTGAKAQAHDGSLDIDL